MRGIYHGPLASSAERRARFEQPFSDPL